ncbi:putative DNA helicase Pif1, P-loop containing nucleoside triphosphate hydrolase [Helianthus debilis subsp. tardiflorus]
MYRRDNTTAPQPEDFFDDPKLPIATGDENVEEELIDSLEELEEGELRERLTDVERRRYPVPCDRPTWILPPPPQAHIHNIPDSQVPSHANISARARLFTMRPIYWWGYDAEDRAFVTKHKGGYHIRFYSIHDVMKLPRESLDRMVDGNMYNPTDYHLAKSLELHLRRNYKNEYANFSRKPGQRFDVWRKGNVRKIYSEAMNAAGWTFPLANDLPGVFFIDGPGGTGKTFLYNALLAQVRARGLIALATTSSGAAANNMPGGRTVHSRFKIPINLDNNSMCNIKKQSGAAELIRSCKLII